MTVTEHELRISIISFLVGKFRRAVNDGLDYRSINITMNRYLQELRHGGMTQEEEDILYLESKIKATEEQLQGYKEKFSKLIRRK